MSAVPVIASRSLGARASRERRFYGLYALLLALLPVACVPDAPGEGPPTSPSDRFSVSIAWDAPATDAMGNSLEDLVGFRLYHSPLMPPNGPGSTMIEVGDSTRFRVDNLGSGIYYFAVTAIDEAGNESDLSEALRVEAGGS